MATSFTSIDFRLLEPYRAALAGTGVIAVAMLVPIVQAPDGYRGIASIWAFLVVCAWCAAAAVACYYRDRVRIASRHLAEAQQAVARHAEKAAGSERQRAGAMAASAAAAGRMQAMTTSMLVDLRELEDRHGDSAVLADLLLLDHRTAQAGRVADSVAVLSGARSGRRWAKPIVMESILRGAMGRIAGYQRVRLRAVADVAVAGHGAEGVMHALAELLDNACNFSPPTTEVHVYVTEVPAGLVITIEDSGLVMSESALRRAQEAVSGSASDLAGLSGTRLGLAVVGHLARKHALTVSFRPSAIGGTAVVVMVPQELIVRSKPDVPPSILDAPARTDVSVVAEAPADIPEGALPQRRRGSTLAVTPVPQPATEVSRRAQTSPASFGAFQRAVAPTKENEG